MLVLFSQHGTNAEGEKYLRKTSGVAKKKSVGAVG